MTDIFDTLILCKKCHKEMYPTEIMKEGIEIRAVQCPNCKDTVYHPADIDKLNHFRGLRGKTFNVKLRMIGNSHAISIPKEIIDFMNEQEQMMDEMVRLCFEDMRKLRIEFGGNHDRTI